MVDHGKSTKRKKFHDKDKYYKLAKEQGLRSRAAFKLSQINRQYPILSPSTDSRGNNVTTPPVILDLCAAPGGWTQIAARICGPNAKIIAVDILPIRNLNNRNIHTIVGDITTDKCKADIHRAVTVGGVLAAAKGGKKNGTGGGTVDVVLHDGAPNIGASYDKDAYEQTELAVHALKCATQHLKRGGSFVTKIYRSRDSASYQWVCQQLFGDVTTFKPKASRQQSAEIFYVCQGYLAPDKIDPRLLDPKHIFEFVEGDTTQASTAHPGTAGTGSKFNVFHKSWDKVNKRQRGGYDTDHLDATMRHVESVVDFVFGATSNMDAIGYLSTSTGLAFTCDESRDQTDKDKCQFLLNHPFTTTEIKECVVDLKVLNKSDFKGLMLWRDKMITSWKQHEENIMADKNDDDQSSDGDDDGNEPIPGEAGEEDEDAIQKEIEKMRERKLREKKKMKKKERKLMSKKRRQAALGMDLNAIEVQEHDQFFSLSTLRSVQDLEKVAEVNLDQVTEEQAFGAASDDDNDDDDDEGNPLKGVPERDEDTGYSYRMDMELDAAYEQYLQTTKNNEAKVGTKAAKRSKKLLREKIAQESHEDQEMLLTNKTGMDHDTKVYAKLLQGPKESDDEDEDDDDDNSIDDHDDDIGDDDDGFDAEPVTPEEHHAKKKQKTNTAASKHPLIHEFPDEPTPAKTARWFSNPLFAEIGQVVNAAAVASSTTGKGVTGEADQLAAVLDGDGDDESMDDADGDEEDSDDEPTQPLTKKQKKERATGNSSREGMGADDVLALMPKTDKQKRHEKRIKAKERDERRQARRAKKTGEADGEFGLAPAAGDVDDDDYENGKDTTGIPEERKRKLTEARKLIKAGMGSAATSRADEKRGGSQAQFEVVGQDRPLPIKDDRKYDSDNEEYDSDDYAKTMALGTMMLRQSKAKALVDASYNRFAWNDPNDLPEWFVDDENRHYRPQLPIPPALLAKMKEKMEALSTKPIAKVAEARARKNRKAKLKLAAAKKQAQVVANSSEMSDSMKLKSISKALRSEDNKKGGKTYIVAKKGQGKKSVRGATMVDKRMKSDKRSMERSKRGGKKGGLTGSKKRRHHK